MSPNQLLALFDKHPELRQITPDVNDNSAMDLYNQLHETATTTDKMFDVEEVLGLVHAIFLSDTLAIRTFSEKLEPITQKQGSQESDREEDSVTRGKEKLFTKGNVLSLINTSPADNAKPLTKRSSH